MGKTKRKWRLRIAAMLVGLLPLLAAESLLRFLDLPKRPPAIDPYLDLHNLKPLFQVSSDARFMEIGPERLNLFCPAKFPLAKQPGTFRIFALGGSTTFGEPYSADTAFPKWLQLNLQAAMPDQKIEVVNCGGLSYASYRVLAILQEVLQYDADLVVIYTGQNEYLEQRSYDAVRAPSSVQRAVSWLSELRLVQLARSTMGDIATRDSGSTRTEMQVEVDALLDYQGGLDEYHRDDAWREPVVRHFRWNLEQMCAACREANVPLVLVKPVANLLDCPPMKIETSPSLSSADCQAFEALWNEGRSVEDPATAVQVLQQALELDPEHAGANYLLGKLAYTAGDYEKAKAYLIHAKDFDVCPLRATSAIQQEMVDCCRDDAVPLVDADELFGELSEQAIVGQQWLVDHIHPTIEGHQRLGESLSEKLVELDWIGVTNDDWRTSRKQLYQEHLATLGEAYYHRGKQRLEGLLLWTQGRAKKIRSEQDLGN